MLTSPPPDRIEQLFQELEAKISAYRPRDDFAPVKKAFGSPRVHATLSRTEIASRQVCTDGGGAN